MKTFKKKLIRIGIVLILLTPFGATIAQITFVTINGTLKDAKPVKIITYAAITVPGRV